MREAWDSQFRSINASDESKCIHSRPEFRPIGRFFALACRIVYLVQLGDQLRMQKSQRLFQLGR